jgi:hypothetical protein
VHGGVVPDHGPIQQQDLLAAAADAHAELIVLGGDDIGAKAADGTKGFGAHHEDAAAGVDLAGILTPLQIEEPVIRRGLRMNLAHMAADDGHVRSGL